jgi:septation ring formation regulator EzrA
MSTLSVEEVEMPAAGDDFSTLEDRVQRVVETLKRERAARAEAAENAARVEKLLQAQTALLEQAQAQLKALERDREQVRQRVERLVKHIEEIAS